MNVLKSLTVGLVAVSATTALLSWVATPLVLSADSGYTQGVSLYQSKKFREAASQFEKLLASGQNNANVLYYCAMSQQQCNNQSRARQLYEYIATNFSNSAVAPMAQKALNAMGGSAGTSSLSGTATGSASAITRNPGQRSGSSLNLASVPDESRVHYRKSDGGDIVVDLAINNRPIEFILDTGAFATTVGANHLRQIGVIKADKKQELEVGGVGATKSKAWHEKMDFRLGQIYIKDYPFVVQDNMPTEPLLGQDFLRLFDILIDEESHQVILRKRGSAAQKSASRAKVNTIEIPFRRGPSGHMFVQVKVCGKPYVMMFDTGAQGIAFTTYDFKRMGLEVPSAAQRGTVSGVGGTMDAYYFPIESISLGPRGEISKENVRICVAMDDSRSIALLGQDFFGSYKYHIDSERGVIVFDKSQL